MSKELGVYIHIPFCESRCYYCDFFSSVSNEDIIDKYVEAICEELAFFKNRCSDYIVDSIYYGGGTPSLLSINNIAKIQNCLYKNFCVEKAEITMEMNPNSSRNMKNIRNMGINRLSVGIQSLDDRILKKIGRIHTSKMALDTLEEANKYFDNVSADLILGTDENQDVSYDVNTIAPLVKHLSCYMLKVEPNTVLAKKILNKTVTVATEDHTVDQYEIMMKECKKYGLLRYETSNFALEGYASRHNGKYWDLSPYLGIGAGAHGYSEGRRYYNISDINKYISGENSGQGKELCEREYSYSDELEEYIMLRLRTEKGINISDINKKFRIDFYLDYADKIKKVAQYTNPDSRQFAIKPQYLLLQNSIISQLL